MKSSFFLNKCYCLFFYVNKTKVHISPESRSRWPLNAYEIDKQHEIYMANVRHYRIFGYKHVGTCIGKAEVFEILPNAKPKREGVRVVVEHRLKSNGENMYLSFHV